MTTPGVITALIAVALIVTATVVYLHRPRYVGRHEALAAAIEAERRRAMVDDDVPFIRGGYIVGEEMQPGYNPPSASMNPNATVTPLPAGDTLILIGTELVHRRCVDARRDGGTPKKCCAARLGAVR